MAILLPSTTSRATVCRHADSGAGPLAEKDGHRPAMGGFADKVRLMSTTEEAIRDVIKRMHEPTKKQLGVTQWLHDVHFLE